MCKKATLRIFSMWAIILKTNKQSEHQRIGEKMRIYQTGTLMKDNRENAIVLNSAQALKKAGFPDSSIERFNDDAVSLLNDYAELFGEGTAVTYSIRRRLVKIELRLWISGENYDPFTNGDGAVERTENRVLRLNLNTETTSVSHSYFAGRNMISVDIPLTEKRRKLVKDPMIWAVIMGVIAGIICQHLPENVSDVIVNDLFSPVMSIILDLLAGIMGPVIAISMTAAIIELDSINDLTDLGFKIMRRFVRIALFLMVVSIAVSALFFRSFGGTSTGFTAKLLIDQLLDIIPTNLIEPFLENKTPQLVVLGFLFGTALLLLGDRVKELKQIIIQINEGIMNVMKIILMVVPAIPFLSISMSIAGGNGKELIAGWKFIAASYIIFTICALCKMIKASANTGMSISEFWRKIKPVVKLSFQTGSTSAPMRQMMEMSYNEFHIKREFTSFWLPLCQAMLSPKTTINLIIGAFMAASLSGTAISVPFLVVLIILTLELSIASPGTTSSWAIMLASLGMPTSYVGMFAAYRMLTANYEAACTTVYSVLEQVEAAKKMDAIEKQPI